MIVVFIRCDMATHLPGYAHCSSDYAKRQSQKCLFVCLFVCCRGVSKLGRHSLPKVQLDLSLRPEPQPLPRTSGNPESSTQASGDCHVLP